MLSSLLPTLLPLLIAVSIYAGITFFLLPLYRRHRARYAQYLPMSSSFNPAYYTSNDNSHHDQSSSSPSSPGIIRRGLNHFRETFPSYLFLPSLGDWHRRYGRYRGHQHTTTHRPDDTSTSDPPLYDHDPTGSSSLDRSDTNSLFTPEQGEALVGFDLPRSRREDQGRISSAQISDVIGASSDRRLSRELEEVFRDDSDEEEDDGGSRVGGGGTQGQRQQ